MLLRCLVALAVAATAIEAAVATAGMTRVIIDEATADRWGAKCLDGTRPGYYRRPGASGSEKKWRIHFRGGGWCFDQEACAARAGTYTGSSALLPENITDSPYGFMNVSEPNYGDWALVFVEYCDGSSWTSERHQEVVVGGKSVWHRGRANMEATLDSLDQWNGLLTDAEEVVFTGTSAGGMAVYLNANHLAKRLPETTAVSFLPDAGFFLFAGPPLVPEALRIAISAWNSTANLEPRCLASFPSAPWRCLLPVNNLPHIDYPVFAMQSLYDPTQNACDPFLRGCNESLALFRDWIQGNLTAAATPKTSIFGTGCRQHEESCKDFDWDGITIGGTTAAAAFHEFYTHPGRSRFDVAWPGNPTCTPGVKHGSC